jgi:uncharacterized protein YyaL (SSP411 family)
VDALKLITIAALALMFLGGHVCADTPKNDNVEPVSTQNLLSGEQSPYLLQHADNPVHWHPWSDEAFELARKLDRPVFLSIGYATCHWCHVMEHESFEDTEVANLMNSSFVNIKVDREERPDIDQVYMSVCQMMTGSGGWPLTIVMTPDRKPFFAGTYIPKQSMYGRIGMLELVPKIASLWNDRRDELLRSADTVVDHLRSAESTIGRNPLELGAMSRAVKELKSRYDATHGGFGQAPKFPSPHNLVFLIRQARQNEDKHALAMVEHTLTAMRRGGIYDHVGFGFHRYSTDREWLVPHFEKMLYDQAMLVLAYTEAFTTTGKSEYAQTVREVLAYVQRAMTSPEGAFYSAEDADSEGEEGKFYVWTADEIANVVGESASNLARAVWNIRKEGNFVEETGGGLTGANIPHLSESPSAIARSLDREPEDLENELENIRQKLFTRRELRVHPLKDDKVLTDWNGLMAAALAHAGLAFDNKDYVAAARRAVDFIHTHMRDESGRLHHRYRNGHVAVPAFLDDYSFLIWAELELYSATLEAAHLLRAVELQNEADVLFWDSAAHGYFYTAPDNEARLVLQKEIYDGAIPSGNSVAWSNLVRLAKLTGRVDLSRRADQMSIAFGSQISRMPSGHTWALQGFAIAAQPSLEVVICGEYGSDQANELLDVVRSNSGPDDAILFLPPGPDGDSIRKLAEYSAAYTMIEDKATAYVCRNFQCELPTTDPQKLKELLQAGGRASQASNK